MNSVAGRLIRRDLAGSCGSRYRKEAWSPWMALMRWLEMATRWVYRPM